MTFSQFPFGEPFKRIVDNCLFIVKNEGDCGFSFYPGTAGLMNGQELRCKIRIPKFFASFPGQQIARYFGWLAEIGLWNDE